jgi:hypothetical protein
MKRPPLDPPHPGSRSLRELTRRHFFRQGGFGIGALGLSSLLEERLFAAGLGDADPRSPKPLQFAPKAKRVIYLFMAGAPSQVDLFDPKPQLKRHDGEPIPEELVKGERFAFIKGTPRLLGSPYAFEKVGRSGLEVSELLPHFKSIADEVAVLRSLQTTQFNHAPAQIYMNTGHQVVGRPAFGSWLSYGLGSENRDLPAFVVLISGQNNPDGGKSCWGSGFLPTVHQGVELRNVGEPVLFLSDPPGVSRASRRDSLDVLRALNERHRADTGDPEIDTRIGAYELAYRMQTSVPELSDLSREPAAVHEAYGTEPGKVSFANNCLLARRLVERGVRFVQLYHRGWDHHGTSAGDDIVHSLPKLCREVDRASAALVRDLKQRGLLDETLVVWGGEFGRTPMIEGRNHSRFLGRDHHPHAFSVWLAGGGIRPGVVVGATDELGYNPVEDAADVHDLHATLLRLLGIDHTKLVYRFQGRPYRLTDVSGNVITKLLA